MYANLMDAWHPSAPPARMQQRHGPVGRAIQARRYWLRLWRHAVLCASICVALSFTAACSTGKSSTPNPSGTNTDLAGSSAPTAEGGQSSPGAQSAPKDAAQVADKLGSVTTPRPAMGSGYKFNFGDEGFFEGPKAYNGQLGSVTWNVFYELPGKRIRGAWGAGILVFPSPESALAYAAQLKPSESTCSTTPRPAAGFNPDTMAFICQDNGSPPQAMVSATEVRGRVLGNYAVSAPQEDLTLAAAKSVGSSLSATISSVAGMLG